MSGRPSRTTAAVLCVQGERRSVRLKHRKFDLVQLFCLAGHAIVLQFVEFERGESVCLMGRIHVLMISEIRREKKTNKTILQLISLSLIGHNSYTGV